MSTQGRVVWHDLNTTDLDGARRFYGELFNWNIREQHGFAFIYPHDNEHEHFGTVIPIDASRTMPPSWIPYLAVDRFDDALATLTASGGKALTPKMPAGKTGFFAYVTDPQGAVFSLWQYHEGQPKPEVAPDAAPAHGQFVWDELQTPNPAAAEPFYTRVFGYTAHKMSNTGTDYVVWERSVDGQRRGAGGMMQSQPGVPHPFWLGYVAVTDCNRSAEQAHKLGATVAVPPMDIPTVGRFALLLDPAGATIGILGPTP